VYHRVEPRFLCVVSFSGGNTEGQGQASCVLRVPASEVIGLVHTCSLSHAHADSLGTIIVWRVYQITFTAVGAQVDRCATCPALLFHLQDALPASCALVIRSIDADGLSHCALLHSSLSGPHPSHLLYTLVLLTLVEGTEHFFFGPTYEVCVCVPATVTSGVWQWKAMSRRRAGSRVRTSAEHGRRESWTGSVISTTRGA
jgi:hypothetical protein